MSTHWHEPRAGGKVNVRPRRADQGYQKARLGLAAEDPIRVGLPRHHTTEHHTEVQVFDFTLSPYMPSELEKLTKFHHLCMYRIWFAVRDRQEEAVVAGVTGEGGCFTKEEVFAIPMFPNWIWKVIKEGLVKGREMAYTLDASADKVEIPRQFWLSSYADEAMKTGRIEKIELFAPEGEIFILAEQMRPVLDAIYNMMYLDTALEGDRSLKLSSTPASLPDSMIKIGGESSNDTYDKDLFYKILVCDYYSNGFPEKRGGGAQTAYRQRLIQAYVDAGGPGGAPSMAWVKNRVLPIQRELRVIDEGSLDDASVPLLPGK